MTRVTERHYPVSHNRWSILALLSVAELLGMSLWFSASAVSAHFQVAWNLSPEQTGWLTTVVQLGFVAGTAIAAALNLADILPSRVLFAVSALLAAAANATLVIAPNFHTALVLRFLTGLLLAGVYPPAMKMIATWFVSARGLAIGTIVGALTLGKALPYLLHAFPSLDFRAVILAASCGAAIGGLLIAVAYRDGPSPFARRAFSWRLVSDVLRHRETRLAIAGYLGHMWELYAMWSLVSAFFVAVLQQHGASAIEATAMGSLIGFAAIATGAAGSVFAGAWADRFGRERIAIGSMIISGACALCIGWFTALPTGLLVALALVWGFAIVADSAQFSALVTECAPSHAVGTALTLQTSLGFLLTAFSIWLTVLLSTRVGWGVAFSILAIGPALGILAMVRLRQTRTGVRVG
jgi:MFS family permease